MATSQVADMRGQRLKGEGQLFPPVHEIHIATFVKCSQHCGGEGGWDSPRLFIHLFLFWMLLPKLSHLNVFANHSCVVKAAPQPYQSPHPVLISVELCLSGLFFGLTLCLFIPTSSVSVVCLLLPYIVLSCHYRCCK